MLVFLGAVTALSVTVIVLELFALMLLLFARIGNSAAKIGGLFLYIVVAFYFLFLIFLLDYSYDSHLKNHGSRELFLVIYLVIVLVAVWVFMARHLSNLRQAGYFCTDRIR